MRNTLRSSSISPTSTSNTALPFILAALKNTTSRSSPSVNLSISFRTAGMESRSERSSRSVSTFTLGLAFETKAASSFLSLSSLRARRMAWLKSWEANCDTTWLPMPGPAPKARMVRVGDLVDGGRGGPLVESHGKKWLYG